MKCILGCWEGKAAGKFVCPLQHSAYFSTSIWEGPSLSCTSEGQLVVWDDISQILQTGLGSALLLQKSS